MADILGDYAKPIKIEKHKLADLYYLKPLSKPDKPNRELLVAYDDRFPLVKNHSFRYVYLVKFLSKDSLGANHYHQKRHELFTVVSGEALVKLEDVKTKERKEIVLKAKDNTMLYVKPKVAHVVIPQVDNSTLLVFSDISESTQDVVKYKVE